MKLIVENLEQHFAKTVIDEFEDSIISELKFGTVRLRSFLFCRILWKIVRTISSNKKCVLAGKEDYFAVCMGASQLWKCIWHFIKARKRHVYLFDAWPKDHDVIEHVAKMMDIDTIFFSSHQAAKEFDTIRDLKARCLWVPEGIDASLYHYKAYDQKDIDVLNFGRKWEKYHEQIVGPLSKAGTTYLYEKKRMDIIFEDKNDFRAGLARSRVSVCVPKNITHSSYAGNISTMTSRYLQSMASKCLIIGIMPEEMKRLFNYNPIIEIDQKNPSGQLLDILRNYQSFIPLVEKNFKEVHAHHTWKRRLETIVSEIGGGNQRDGETVANIV